LISSAQGSIVQCRESNQRHRRCIVAKFVTVGYGDRAGYDATDPKVRDRAHEHDQSLQAAGALIGIAGQPVQVRNHDGEGVEILEGAFLQAELPIAGFAVLDASNLDEAIALASKAPCAVAHGVVEVWPLMSTPDTPLTTTSLIRNSMSGDT
jgi:hypothetical protein